MRQTVTVLFADCRGFTSLAHRLPPEELVRTMNRFFEKTVEVLLRHDACVDKFLGDEVMAVFGAPIPNPYHAQAALEAAFEIQDATRTLFQEPDGGLAVGIGLNTGEAIVGNVGSPQVMDFTALGDPVNVAAHLQHLAGPGEVLATETTYAALQAPPAATTRMIALKGSEDLVPVRVLRSPQGPATLAR